ncbi:MAG: hypothetical protein HY000_02455, partial [Planctomycetes bacterium]|nr:hypothetical protein [Planctomycetota bacterium]
MPGGRLSAARVLPWAELAGFGAAAAAVVALELSRHPEYIRQPHLLLAYRFDPETTLVGLAILAAPMLWWRGGRTGVESGKGAIGGSDVQEGNETEPQGPSGSEEKLASDGQYSVRRHLLDLIIAWFLSVILFGLSVTLTALVGLAFRDMPPAFHDEYSSLFQAKTFLAGRLYFPQHRLPEFFDQMHVLNDQGVFASRFFPGVGLWLAPWVALGRPYWGQYLAGGLIVVLVFWIGRELGTAGDRVPSSKGSGAAPNQSQPVPAGWGATLIGFLAAFFCAVSPAMLLFGNLLLSHHPTMLGLAAFVLCYLRALRSERLVWPALGGIALSLAMLCRPLTAFGFALPFGAHLGWLVARSKLTRCSSRVTTALVPLVVAVGLLAGYNALLSGSPLRTPYGLYTRIYSPNHSYGFHNVTRGQKVSSPKVLENYNQWAEELTVPRAFRLLGTRAVASSAWSMGPVSLAWIVPVLVVMLAWLPAEWRLLAAAIVGLHAAYFSFAFEGIFGLSYVFESVPVLCLLVAGLSVWLGGQWLAQGRGRRVVWLSVFVLLGLTAPLHRLVDSGPDGGIAQVRFARRYYADF